MVRIPDFEGMFLPLLRSVQDKTAPSADHVDAYLRLTERLREEKEDFLTEVCQHVTDVTAVLKRDTQSSATDLSQAALQALGHCLYQEQLSRSFSEEQASDILEVLVQLVESTEDKGVCTRALWCIAKQNLATTIVLKKLEKILSCLSSLPTKGLLSATVDFEAVCVVERLLGQLPIKVMAERASSWSRILIHMTVSSATKVREQSVLVLMANLELLVSCQQQIIPWLLPELKSGLVSKLSKLCHEKNEIFVLKVWSCIVPVLGRVLHKGSLLNEMLKLVEQGFKNSSVDVQVSSYSAWRVLIDNFALTQDVLCTPKRIKLIMMPFLNSAVRERNERVESARLTTWWHFICCFHHEKVAELFNQICIPLLQFIFGTAIDQTSLLKSKDGFSDLKCPPTPTTGKLMTDSDMVTPKSHVRRSLKDVGTPKTPTVIHASFAQAAKQKLLLQGCYVLAQFLQTDATKMKDDIRFALAENLQGCVFKTADVFEKNALVMISATREAFKSSGYELDESLTCSIWESLVTHVGNLVDFGKTNHKSTFLPLVATLEDLVEGSFLPPSTCLKLLEIMSKMLPHTLSHSHKSLQCKSNLHGSAAVLLLQLIFSPRVLKEGQNQERFHIVIERFVSCGIADAAVNQLGHVQSILQLLDATAGGIDKKETFWRLWTSVVSPLNELIIKTNDVNQGNALEHDFSGVELALLLPFKHLIDSSLSQALIKLTNKALSGLYKWFSCAAALVPSADANTSAEELCAKLLSVWNDSKAKDVVFVDSMVNLTTIILECVDFSNPSLFDLASTAAGKSPNRTPTKWGKKLERPLGNLTSVVVVMGKVIDAGCNLINEKATSKWFGVFASFMTSLVEGVSMLFAHINGSAVISSTLQLLATPLAPVIRGAHVSTKEKKTEGEKKLFNNKFIQKVEKLWVDILTCISSRHEGPYNSQLLAVLSPLLEVTFCHNRRQFKNQVVMFWNSTFALAETLEYPDALRPILQIVKDKMSLTLPNWDATKVSVRESQIPDQESEEMSQYQPDREFAKPRAVIGSPVRRKPLTFSAGSPHMRGSFLHKAAEAEKAVSPRKAQTEPRHGAKLRTSSGNTHARRKLPLSIFDDDSQDYTAIAPSPTKKRLLTEHQKEVMRERRVVPAMYNCLDQSQDGSMFIATQESTWTPSPKDEMPAPFEKPKESKIDENDNVAKEESYQFKDVVDEEELSSRKEPAEEQEVMEPAEEREVMEPAAEQEVMEPAAEQEVMDTTEVSTRREVAETQEMDDPEEIAESLEGSIEDAFRLDGDNETEAIPSVPETLDTEQPEEVASSTVTSRVNDVIISPERSDKPEDEDMTSPDLIPSSQSASGTDSSFQSLRRKSLNASLNVALVVLSDVREQDKSMPSNGKEDVVMDSETSAEDLVEEETSDVIEGDAESSCKEESNVTKAESPSREFKTKSLLSVEARISPVAGRTRRGRKIKSDTPQRVTKTRSTKKEKSESQHSLDDFVTKEIVQEERELQEIIESVEPEPAVISKDVASSPVSCAKIKFMRPNTGSPNRLPARNLHSPVASPSTGILKRVVAAGRNTESPSPPNKVRRVSFALPLQQSEELNPPVSPDKVAQFIPDIPDLTSEPPALKTTPSGGRSFTIIKRRRSSPAVITKPQPIDTRDSVYPDLVDCTLPVEQILPSLCTSSWSRGLGHVVHAQNIRTIGNLSALKEHQIRNLPIRSPKVETLRKVLSSFHKRTKSPRTRLVMKDTQEKLEKLDIVMEEEEQATNSSKTVEGLIENQTELKDLTIKDASSSVEIKPSVTKEMEKVNGKEAAEVKPSAEVTKEVKIVNGKEALEVITVDNHADAEADKGEEVEKDLSVEHEVEEEAKEQTTRSVATEEGSDEEVPTDGDATEKTYTPPLPVISTHEKQEDDSAGTPKRCTAENPTTLFTPEDENVEPGTIENIENEPTCEDMLDTDTLNYLEEEQIVTDVTDPVAGEVPTGAETIEGVTSTDSQVIEEPVEPCEGQRLCSSVESMLELASPDVLARLSSAEIFTTHQNLSQLMSRVVDALQVRWQSPPTHRK